MIRFCESILYFTEEVYYVQLFFVFMQLVYLSVIR